MRSQTGLDHTLLANDVPVVTSLPGGAALTREAEPVHNQASQGTTFDLSGKPYYARRMILQAASGNTPSIQAEVALDVADMVSTGQRLIRVLLASIALASAVGFVLAAFLTRRISRPLRELARRGNGNEPRRSLQTVHP